MFGRTTRRMLITLVVYRQKHQSLLYGHVYILVALLRSRRTRTLVKFQKDHDQLSALFTGPPLRV
jgi:hypothetical protein